MKRTGCNLAKVHCVVLQKQRRHVPPVTIAPTVPEYAYGQQKHRRGRRTSHTKKQVISHAFNVLNFDACIIRKERLPTRWIRKCSIAATNGVLTACLFILVQHIRHPEFP
ncbi:hypothetical protein TcG_05136 [Trypanosoma cruzi]|nr:hypothetical protein TcG_05136 [Trypanosoma cruzi]